MIECLKANVGAVLNMIRPIPSVYSKMVSDLWLHRRLFLIFSLSLIFFLLIFIFSVSMGVADSVSEPSNSELYKEMKIVSTPNPVGSGARALGMGGAFISIADDATAASWNPGALTILKKPEIAFVVSFDNGKKSYETPSVSGRIDDLSNENYRLNYLSIVHPFILFSKFAVISFNYQHLFEFSFEESSEWTFSDNFASLLEHSLHKKQKGGLSSLSPALAIRILPSLSLGLTANIWSDNLTTNYWENISTIHVTGIELGDPKRSFAQLFEKYKFSGFNLHCGFLWDVKRNFKIGGVIKTPFRASVDHRFLYLRLSENLVDIADREYVISSYKSKFKINMPVSYGLGSTIGFFNNYLLLSLDVYRTHWEDYLIITTSSRRSPINNKLEHEANIRPTTQVRFGAEYLLSRKRILFPLRAGLFYDPEPAEGKVNDFFGISFGTGIAFKDFSFDIAYQYRFGKKDYAESMLGKDVTVKSRRHHIYSSMIIYF